MTEQSAPVSMTAFVRTDPMWTVHIGVAGAWEIFKTIFLLLGRRYFLIFFLLGRFSLRAGVTSFWPRLSTRFLETPGHKTAGNWVCFHSGSQDPSGSMFLLALCIGMQSVPVFGSYNIQCLITFEVGLYLETGSSVGSQIQLNERYFG